MSTTSKSPRRVVDIQSHMVLAMLTEQDPKNDVQSLVPPLDRCVANVCVHHLLADAGYDSVTNMAFSRPMRKINNG